MMTGSQSDSADARLLLERQLERWPEAGAGYEALSRVEVKTLFLNGFKVKVQHNAARIISSGAVTDAVSLGERPCFLCAGRLSPFQETLPMGEDYNLLCNPYPIFPEHFTIAARQHVGQSIYAKFTDFTSVARCLEEFTVFYNGPRSGASLPTHLHFQAVTSLYMPVDRDVERFMQEPFLESGAGNISLLSAYGRGGFVIDSGSEAGCYTLFRRIYKALPLLEGDSEPRMNIFCRYGRGRWRVTVIPRILHRPMQYYAEGNEHILTSPGAADIGGVFITTSREDFDKITPPILYDIYSQVTFSDRDILNFSQTI
ncbi:MAG: DUF4922 domain-containing protein [Tannerellaceae bacterium]|jgi:hypothetical protein|nr:DUF4922 domain-containing protein [Tannerellaceae bacterium]